MADSQDSTGPQGLDNSNHGERKKFLEGEKDRELDAQQPSD